MTEHYSPGSFLRHAPNAMLKRYSGKSGIESAAARLAQFPFVKP